MNQIAQSDEVWNVYPESQEQRGKFARAARRRWRHPPSTLIDCQNRERTIEEKEEQENIVKTYHEGETNHRGVQEPVRKLRRKYFWQDLVRVVAGIVKSCKVCKINKADRRRVRPD